MDARMISMWRCLMCILLLSVPLYRALELESSFVRTELAGVWGRSIEETPSKEESASAIASEFYFLQTVNTSLPFTDVENSGTLELATSSQWSGAGTGTIAFDRSVSTNNSVWESVIYESVMTETGSPTWATSIPIATPFATAEIVDIASYGPISVVPVSTIFQATALLSSQDIAVLTVTTRLEQSIQVTGTYSASYSIAMEAKVMYVIRFQGNCSVLYNSDARTKFQAAFSIIVGDSLNVSANQVSYPKPIECGSIIVSFAVTNVVSENNITVALKHLFSVSLNISIEGETFYSIPGSFEEIVSRSLSTATVAHTSTLAAKSSYATSYVSVSATPSPTPTTQGKDLTILYAIVGSMVGFILVVIAIVLVFGFGRKGKRQEFKTHQLKYELGDFHTLPRSQVTAMYGEESAEDAAKENQHQFGNNLPKWGLQPVKETAVPDNVKHHDNPGLEEDE